MATYRRLQPADLDILAAFYQIADDPDVSRRQWERYLASDRERIYAAFADNGSLAGIIEGVISKARPKLCYFGRFKIRAGLSLRTIRQHRNEVVAALVRIIPDDWDIYGPNFPDLTVAREWIEARWPAGHWIDNEDGTRTYLPVPVADLKAAL